MSSFHLNLAAAAAAFEQERAIHIDADEKRLYDTHTFVVAAAAALWFILS